MRRFLLFLFSMALFGLTVVLMLPVLRSTSVRTARAVAAADSAATAAGCDTQAVYAYRIGLLRLDRRQVAFGEVAEGCPVEVRIRVVNDGSSRWSSPLRGCPPASPSAANRHIWSRAVRGHFGFVRRRTEACPRAVSAMRCCLWVRARSARRSVRSA